MRPGVIVTTTTPQPPVRGQVQTLAEQFIGTDLTTTLRVALELDPQGACTLVIQEGVPVAQRHYDHRQVAGVTLRLPRVVCSSLAVVLTKLAGVSAGGKRAP